MSKVIYRFGYDKRLSMDFDSEKLPQDGQRMISYMENTIRHWLGKMSHHHLKEFLNNESLQREFQMSAMRHYLRTGQQPIYTVHKCILTHDSDEHQKAKEHVKKNWLDNIYD